MISNVLIKGNLCAAAYMENNLPALILWLPEDDSFVRNDEQYGLYAQIPTETRTLRKDTYTKSDVEFELRQWSRKYRALDYFLGAMDSGYDRDLRTELLQLGSSYCKLDPSIQVFVRNRLLSCPRPHGALSDEAYEIAAEQNLTNEAEVFSALSSATREGTISSTYNLVMEQARDFWEVQTNEDHTISLEYNELERNIIDSGLVSEFVLSTLSNDYKSFFSLINDLIFNSNLANRTAPSRKLVQQLSSALKSQVSTTKAAAATNTNSDGVDSEKYSESSTAYFPQTQKMVSAFFDGHESNQTQPRHVNRYNENAVQAAQGQVQYFSESYSAGRVTRVDRELANFLQTQLRQDLLKEACMTASNLASNIIDIDAEASLELYDYAILINPNDVVARSGRAETLRALGRHEQALEAYEAAIDAFPNSVVARNGRAETLRALGRHEQALEAYEAAIDAFPNDVVARAGRAETLRALGRHEQALEAYEAAIDAFPNSVVARAGRAETLRALGRHEQALEAYEAAIDAFPNDVVARAGRAETLRALGRHEQALEAYEAAIDAFPNSVVARNGRAETLRALGRHEQALEAYEAAIDAFPNSVVARSGRAETLRALGRHEQALEAYEAAIDAFPNSVVARAGRAETLRALGRHEQALEAYEAAIDAFPNSVVARSGRAETLRALGRHEQALEAYEAAIDAFPNSVVARNGRAETLRALGRHEQALEAYEAAIDAFPNDVVARAGRAETLRALGRHEQALEAYEAAIDAFPNSVVARAGRAETLRALGRHEQALEAYEAAIDAFPNNRVVKNAYACALLRAKRYDDAQRVLTIGEPHSEQDWRDYYVHLNILWRSDHRAEAEERLDYALSQCQIIPSLAKFRSLMAFWSLQSGDAPKCVELATNLIENDANIIAFPQLLRSHAFHELKAFKEAKNDLDEARSMRYEPEIINLADWLSQKYNLENQAKTDPDLDRKIFEAESELVLSLAA